MYNPLTGLSRVTPRITGDVRTIDEMLRRKVSEIRAASTIEDGERIRREIDELLDERNRVRPCRA